MRSLQESLTPTLKLTSHLNVPHHTFVHRLEIIRGFPLPILESPFIGAEPPATSLHNVGTDLRRPVIFLQAVQQVTANPSRQLSSRIYPILLLYESLGSIKVKLIP